jgi:transposase-like protein
MNIIERGKAFLGQLTELANRTAWDWKRCPHCGSGWTIKNGGYHRHPWGFEGRDTVRVQRHLCRECQQTYPETSPFLVRGSWYYREVHRAAVDHWLHLGTSLRRTAEVLRSWIGHQERWQLWRPLDTARRAHCSLSASTVHRWLDKAGERAVESVPEQLAGIGEPQELGTDGLWAKLKGQVVRVVLMMVDSVSGLIYPPTVARGEESASVWAQLFARAEAAGLDLQKVRGLCSDGAQGLLGYLRKELTWVQQQRCVWHIWRGLSGDLARAASQAAHGVIGNAAEEVRKTVRGELVKLVHAVIDAAQAEAAEAALVQLLAHPYGRAVGTQLTQLMDRLLVYQMDYCDGLQRVSPEWYWRDFRLRLSRGRNHRSAQRLERAALLWAVYHNFEPAQWRSEHQRHYRHPGQSALQVAGVPPGQVSYLDALGV